MFLLLSSTFESVSSCCLLVSFICVFHLLLKLIQERQAQYACPTSFACTSSPFNASLDSLVHAIWHHMVQIVHWIVPRVHSFPHIMHGLVFLVVFPPPPLPSWLGGAGAAWLWLDVSCVVCSPPGLKNCSGLSSCSSCSIAFPSALILVLPCNLTSYSTGGRP